MGYYWGYRLNEDRPKPSSIIVRRLEFDLRRLHQYVQIAARAARNLRTGILWPRGKAGQWDQKYSGGTASWESWAAAPWGLYIAPSIP